LKQWTRALARSLLVCGGLFYSLPATAATSDPLSQQIEQLRQQVYNLEARVQQLEHTQQAGCTPVQDTATPAAALSTVPASATAAPATNPAPVSSFDPALESLGRLKEAWKGISSGLNHAQVRERLGEPDRQFTIDGKAVWHYSYPGVGSGSVMFSTSGLVIGAQHPPFSFW